MKLDEAITKFKNNAEYERTHGNLQGCLEFRQIAEWLEKYQKIQKTYERFQKDDNYHPVMAWLDVMAVINERGYSTDL